MPRVITANAKVIESSPDLDVCQNLLVFTFEAPCSNQMGGRSGRPGEPAQTSTPIYFVYNDCWTVDREKLGGKGIPGAFFVRATAEAFSG